MTGEGRTEPAPRLVIPARYSSEMGYILHLRRRFLRLTFSGAGVDVDIRTPLRVPGDGEVDCPVRRP
jgi:hypothetical protein